MKTNNDRIEFYTRKNAEYFSVHHSKRRKPYRYERLANYQKALNKRLQEQDIAMKARVWF